MDDYTIWRRTMSEYLNAEIHDSIDHLEIRFEYEGRRYGLVITPEMFDLLSIDEGKDSPVLAKIMVSPQGWINQGVDIVEGGFNLAW
jgi:hypothetical protein